MVFSEYSGEETNIFPDLFHSAMARINLGMETDDSSGRAEKGMGRELTAKE